MEAPEEYPPHFRQVKGHFLKAALGSWLKYIRDFLPAMGQGKEHMRSPPHPCRRNSGPHGQCGKQPCLLMV